MSKICAASLDVLGSYCLFLHQVFAFYKADFFFFKKKINLENSLEVIYILSPPFFGNDEYLIELKGDK